MPGFIGAMTNHCDIPTKQKFDSSNPQLHGPVYKTFWAESGRARLATHITADLNVPHTLVGHRFEYGTSVFASGRAALELARIELARSGIPKEELDKLSTAHVSLQKVTVTYLLRFASQAEISSFLAEMGRFAKLLGLNIERNHFANTIEYRERRSGKQPDFDSADGNPIQLSEEFVLTAQHRPTGKLVRLEMTLEENYLRSRGWESLDSWRNAYAEKRYTAIFNETVRKLFRLDEDKPCFKEPVPETYACLNPFEDEMVQGYIADKDPMTLLRHKLVMSDARKKKELNNLRKSILDKSGLDIKIPWRDHQQLRPHVLTKKLKYPGDFQPDEERVQLSFCQQNWPQLLDKLRRAYTETEG